MKAVIVTATGPEHIYVSNALVSALGDDIAGIVLETPSPQPVGHSISRAIKRYGLTTTGERLLTKTARRILRHDQRQRAAHRKVLGECSAQWRQGLHVIRTPSVNDEQASKFIQQIGPTHLLVYGTGIVRKRTLELASVGALNMHTGLSPYYRGSDTEFWPLFRGEPHMVGVTVHECTAALDGGAIYARASVSLEPNDDAFLAVARCVKVGAHVYASVATRLASGARLTPFEQDLGTGRLYRFVDRTFLHDVAMEYKMRSGAVRRSIARMADRDLPFRRPADGW